jgi:hypothetical protein
VLVVAGGIVLARWDPSSIFMLPRCPLKAWLGLECPGCGSTRAVHQLLHLRLGNAWRYNPAMVILGLPAVGLLAIDLMGTLIAGRRVVLRLGGRFGTGLVVLLMMYFVGRNLPVGP